MIPAPPGRQATAEARAALSLLDRVFPPEQCRHDPDDVWAPGAPPPRTPDPGSHP